MATTLYKASQFFITTLNVGGGIDSSQTTGITIADDSGIDDVTQPGIALINYADPLNTSTAEWVTFTSISSKVLQGVTRGAEGYSAKAHDNGVQVAFPISQSHINNLATALSIGGSAINGIEGFLDEDTMSSNSATKGATQQSIKAYVDTEIAGAGSTDGWTSSSDTWVYASATTFTIAGVDRTSIYTKGTKVRYKDGGSYEYGYVKSSSFSTNTTVTLVTNADYTIANATITDPSYSYAENPQGFPEWFAFTTTFTGFSADPSTATIYFKLSGKMISFYYIDGSDGTSNATSTTFTIPVNSARSSNQAGIIFTKDNGSISTTPGHLTSSAGSAILAAYKTFSQGAWTGSGGKNIFMSMINLEWT